MFWLGRIWDIWAVQVKDRLGEYLGRFVHPAILEPSSDRPLAQLLKLYFIWQPVGRDLALKRTVWYLPTVRLVAFYASSGQS